MIRNCLSIRSNDSRDDKCVLLLFRRTCTILFVPAGADCQGFLFVARMYLLYQIKGRTM